MENLLCPNCKCQLMSDKGAFFCKNCGSRFDMIDGIPVLLPSVRSQSTVAEAEAWDVRGRREETALPLWRALLFKEAAIAEFLENTHHIRFQGRVLEVGTGIGWASAAVKFYYPSSEVYATDVSVSALVKAREVAKLFNVEVDRFIVADIENSPFPDNYFDVIFGCSILHHISTMSRGLTEIYRVLKPGGIYFGMGENMATRLLQSISILLHFKKTVDKYGLPERIYTFGEWREAFKTAGFSDLNIIVSKSPRYKYDSRISLIYRLAISYVPDFIISRFLGSSINIIAKKGYDLVSVDGDCFIDVKMAIVTGQKL